MISNRTVAVFYDILTSYSTVGEIQTLFEMEGITKKPGYSSRYPSARRSEADEYVSSLDLSNLRDIKSLFRTWETFLVRKQHDVNLLTDAMWKQFTKLLELDGCVIIDGKVQSKLVHDFPEYNELIEEFDLEHVQRDWERALATAETDPEDAITAARSMFESTCKWILDQRGIQYEEDGNAGAYYKLVAKELNLAPDQHGDKIFKQILSGVNSIVYGLSGIRNAYGDSHGKGLKNYRPSSRHARMAVNISASTCSFLIETYTYLESKQTQQ